MGYLRYFLSKLYYISYDSKNLQAILKVLRGFPYLSLSRCTGYFWVVAQAKYNSLFFPGLFVSILLCCHCCSLIFSGRSVFFSAFRMPKQSALPDSRLGRGLPLCLYEVDNSCLPWRHPTHFCAFGMQWQLRCICPPCPLLPPLSLTQLASTPTVALFFIFYFLFLFVFYGLLNPLRVKWKLYGVLCL